MDIFPIWQPHGFSTHIIAKNLAIKLGVPTSHTGTLDPMACGVVVVLAGEARHKKYDYAEWLKTYQFDLVFGLTTDTYDGLGLLAENPVATSKGTSVTSTKILSTDQINNLLTSFVGKYSQKVPPYSAIKVKGKPLHFYAQNNLISDIEIPLREGIIYSITLLSLNEIETKNHIKDLLKRIVNVNGNFRQKEIIAQWQGFLTNPSSPAKLQLAKIEVQMTKGLYVRSLGVDIAAKLQTVGFVDNIIRTNNGIYNRGNSHALEDVFGSEYLNTYDFISRS